MAKTVPGPLSYIPEPPEARRLGIGPLIVAGFAVIAFFLGGFGSWSTLAVLDSAALAPGVVVVESNRKTVKHLEGGIVAALLVSEGQHVAAGDPLIRLDPTQTRAKLDQLQAALVADEAIAARLRAERDGLAQIVWPERLGTVEDHDPDCRLESNEEIAGLRGAIASQKQELALLHEQIADYTTLLQKGLVDKPRVLEVRRRAAEIDGDRLKNEAAIARVQQVIAESEIRIGELDTDRVNAAARRQGERHPSRCPAP